MRLRLGDLSDQAMAPGAQYFPNYLFQLGNNEVFVDCGAYDGDTVDELRRASNDQFVCIIAFEPDPDNFSALRSAANGDSRIPYIPLPLARAAKLSTSKWEARAHEFPSMGLAKSKPFHSMRSSMDSHQPISNSISRGVNRMRSRVLAKRSPHIVPSWLSVPTTSQITSGRYRRC